MEWPLMLLLIFGGLVVAMFIGLPIAFSFILVNVLGVIFLWGGESGLRQLIYSFYASISTFTLLAVPLFTLMGEVMFHSGVAPAMIESIDGWIGRIPGRLSLLTVLGGVVLSMLTGTSMASVAILGETLLPEMEKRGYSKSMSLGPILGSGGLAIMIPPSQLAVVLGAIGQISVGGILVGIIFPGLLMALVFIVYIVTKAILQPSSAPGYSLPPAPLSGKLTSSIRHILPLGLVVFAVTGVIFLGIATPTEAAATGTLATLILAAFHRKVGWATIKIVLTKTLRISVMVFMIILGAQAFAQVLATSGASAGLAQFALSFDAPPIVLIILMLVVSIILGMFATPISIMMITLPIFMPIVHSLGYNPVWFGVMFLLTLEMGTISPPYGSSLFVMKGVALPGTTMGEIIKAGMPYLYCDLVALGLIVAFPVIALWLPGMMRS